MKRTLTALALAMMAGQALAQTGFDQLRQIEVNQQQVEAAQRAEYQRQWEAEQARRDANARAAARQRAAVAQAAANEKARKQARNERMEDEDRDLELEEKRLRLQALKAKVARSNDYIDADLRNQAAQTDAIQSSADATRNVSSGAKARLEDAGTADINRSTKLFGN